MAHLHDPLEGIGGDGTIVTGARHARIAPDFRPVLESALERLRNAGGAPSLYVYGSVATGMARVGSSDVDLVTLGFDAGVARKLAAELSEEYRGLCRSVELGPAQWSDYEGPGDEAYGNRVFLRHYCVHLAGLDFASTLPNFAADSAAARGFNGDIHLLASRWRAELAESDPDLLGRRVARKTLFAVAGLVSIHDGTWTTDRVAASRRWSEVKPGLAAELATLVAWGDVLPPTPTKSDIQAVLESVIPDVVDEFRDRIGLWRCDGDGVSGDA
jgi:predicted nucleotidyltransferase